MSQEQLRTTMEDDNRMSTLQIITLGEAAVGSIGPGPRIESGEITKEDVDSYISQIMSGDFDVQTDDQYNGANAAGGTFTLVVADALTERRFYKPGMTAAQHSKAVYSWLIETQDTSENRRFIPRQCIDGRRVVDGGEASKALIGDHGPDCGAQNKFADILPAIVIAGDTIRAVVESEGIQVRDNLHDTILSNARDLLSNDYVVDGDVLRLAFTETAGESTLPQLEGSHLEVVARKNNKPNTTLDRMAAESVVGPNLEAFNVDAWAFEPSARVMSESGTDESVEAYAIAMQYFNTATTLYLGHESLNYGVKGATK